MSQDQRYAGNPMLRLVDAYVCWSIGELDDEQARLLDEMTPKLQDLYGLRGSWQEIVAAQMEYPDSLPEQLRNLWREQSRAAGERGEVLPMAVFVQQVVDSSLT